MTLTLTPVAETLLEKCAGDNGFDLEEPRQGAWLCFASSHAPLRIWLSALGDGVFITAFSQLHVAKALKDFGVWRPSPLPSGAQGGGTVEGLPALHRLLRRAYQLSRTLPDELLHTYEKQTAALPKTTEAERLVVQRVGQDLFRKGLLEYWEGQCAMTGLAVKELLRASHIKRWADCDDDAERLDIFNGLLLAPHLDAAFDLGFITVADSGEVVVSPALSTPDRGLLHLDEPLKVHALTDGHRHYLAWHRNHWFRKS